MDWFAAFINGFTLPVLLCLGVGLLLLIVEMFIPGFGVAGFIGAILLLVAVILRADSLRDAAILLALIIIVVGGGVLLFFRSVTKGRLSRSPLVLKDAIVEDSGAMAQKDADEFLGCEGVTLTPLHPAGVAEFSGRRLDVVSQGGFIENATAVTIVSIEGPRIVVRPKHTDAPQEC